MSLRLLSGLLAALTILPAAALGDTRPASRVTILVDAFGKPSALRMDWGYSALVEYGGRRILFDAGNSAEVFAECVTRVFCSGTS
jgi:7,8-dihydropterin-6-yl-methyl-4-(beta-D-ribofuranosyl)aminobenzene 5'-phosphate synthase